MTVLSQSERMARVESKHRNNSVEENLKWFEELLKGSPQGRTYCMRAKIDMSSVNGTMRDPVLYRFVRTTHYKLIFQHLGSDCSVVRRSSSSIKLM